MADALDNLGMASPQSALDFAGLGALRTKAQQNSDKALRETATQFEAMFIHEMLKSMRETVEKSDLMGSDVEDQFTQMYDRELSMQLAKRNTLGVADMIVKTVERTNSGGAQFKAKAEPMQLKPDPTAMAIEGPKAMPVIRPDKFTIKPRAVTTTGGTGAE